MKYKSEDKPPEPEHRALHNQKHFYTKPHLDYSYTSHTVEKNEYFVNCWLYIIIFP